MIALVFLSCLSSKTNDSHIETADTAEEIWIDEDGDGYFRNDRDALLVDCDDDHIEITPSTHRYIPAGTFIRGWDLDTNTSPAMEITLSSYCIGVYEVTNAEFVAFMNEQRERGFPNSTTTGEPLFDFADNDDPYPERIIDNGERYRTEEGYEQHPVVEVYRWSAKAYCEAIGHQLPTEAQWERAARGDDGQIFPWGNDEASCQLANHWPQPPPGDPPQEPCIDDTTPVGSYPAGAWGIYDMAGNVSEWVSDWYRADYYTESPTADPIGPDSGWAEDPMNPDGFEAATARGGSLGSGSGSLRSFHRVPEPLEATSNGLGFRCVFQPTTMD